MHKKCLHELVSQIMDLVDLVDLDLDLDLDNYLLHPQPQHSLRVVHAFMQDRERAIEHVIEERVPLEDGVFRQERLIWCIKQQQQQQRAITHGVHFKLRAMFLYNMDVEPEDLLSGELSGKLNCKLSGELNGKLSGKLNGNFIVPLSAVEDVAVKPTIPMFASLNGLYIMYGTNGTNGNNGNNGNNGTSKKRVMIKDKKSKKCYTRRSTC